MLSSSYRVPPAAAAAAASSSSHYSRYDDDALDNTDEEEEERRLSEQYGEADDDHDRGDVVLSNSNQRNKQRGGGRARANHPTTTTLTEEDAAAAKEFEEKVRRAKKARPSLQPAHLKSAKGLLYVRRAFPTLVKKYPASSSAVAESSLLDSISDAAATTSSLKRKLGTQSQIIKNAARYSRSLVSAYREFARELFPALAAEDVFLKIEDLGSKKEVKDYLQLMREEFRKEYLEGIYGVEKARRLLNELEHGLLQAVHQTKKKKHSPVEGDDDDDYRGDAVGTCAHGSVAPRLGHAVVMNNEDGEEEDHDDIIIAPLPAVASSPTTATAAATTTIMAVNPYSTTSIGHTVTLNADVASGEDEDAAATFSLSENHSCAAMEPVGERWNAAEKEEANDEGNAGLRNRTESEARGSSIDERERNVDGAVAKEDTAEDGAMPPNILGGAIQELIHLDNNDVENDKTQETLTLLESQLDNAEMGASQDDDRFSQQSFDIECDEERKDEMDENFVVGDGRSEMALEEVAHDEEENTLDERFSQFTQSSGLIIEQDVGASQDEENYDNDDKHGNCDQLGQPTQLSMEY